MGCRIGLGEKMGRRASKKTNTASGTISNIFTILSFSYIGKIILYAFLATIAIVITATAAGNDYEKFFKCLGVEVLAIAIVGWIIFLVRKRD